MRCKSTLVVALLLWPTVAGAVDHNGQFKVLGEGSSSCGQWTKDRLEKESWAALAKAAWLRGFITAHNFIGGGTGVWSNNLTQGTDYEGIMGWVDNYCAQHPLDNIADAAQALVVELNERAKGAPVPSIDLGPPPD